MATGGGFWVAAGARDAEEFQASWERVAGQFEVLFTTDASIEKLKRAVRTLAFSGALSASAKSDWKVTRVGEVVEFLNGYAFKSKGFTSLGVRLVRNVNIAHGEIDWRECACIERERVDEFSSFALEAGDILLSLDRPIISTGLKVAVVRAADLPCLLLQRVARLAPKASHLHAAYLLHWLRSPFFTDVIDPGRSNGVPHISTKQVANMTIPLPSLAEQKRLVTLMDELTSLCERLQKKVATVRAKHSHLAEVLVAHTLSSNS